LSLTPVEGWAYVTPFACIPIARVRSASLESVLRRVLCLEDDADNRVLLALALADVGGLEVSFRCDGLETEAAILLEQPDVVLVDLKLPGRDGKTVISEIQRLRREVPFVVVVLSASAPPRWPDVEAANWVDGYVRKPFRPLTLAAQLRRIWAERLSPDRPEDPD
jgi:two-component system, OmpR family, response regulator